MISERVGAARRLSTCCLILLTAACAVSVEQRWEETRSLDTIEAYRAFKRQHSSSPFADAAAARIAEIEADEAWKEASAEDTADAYRRFLKLFNSSDHAPDAAARIAEFEAAEQARIQAERAATPAPAAIEMTPENTAAAEDLLAAYEKENPVDPEMRKRMKEAEDAIKEDYKSRLAPLEERRDTLKDDIDARRKAGRETQRKAADLRKSANELEARANELDNTSSGGFNDSGGFNQSGAASTFGSGGSGGMASASDARKLREQASAVRIQAEDIEAETRVQAEDYEHARGQLREVEDEIKALRKEQREEIQHSWNAIRDEAAAAHAEPTAADTAADEAAGEAPQSGTGGGLFD